LDGLGIPNIKTQNWDACYESPAEDSSTKWELQFQQETDVDASAAAQEEWLWHSLNYEAGAWFSLVFGCFQFQIHDHLGISVPIL